MDGRGSSSFAFLAKAPTTVAEDRAAKEQPAKYSREGDTEIQKRLPV